MRSILGRNTGARQTDRGICIFGFQVSGVPWPNCAEGVRRACLEGWIGAWHAIGGPTLPLDQSTYEV